MPLAPSNERAKSRESGPLPALFVRGRLTNSHAAQVSTLEEALFSSTAALRMPRTLTLWLQEESQDPGADVEAGALEHTELRYSDGQTPKRRRRKRQSQRRSAAI